VEGLIRTAKIIDCTIRDGGHLNGWNFSTDFVAKVVSALSETNIHCIEVGYVSTPGSFPGAGKWRYSTEKDLRAVVPSDVQCKIAVMGDIGKIRKEDFLPKDESIVDVVRLAFYPGHAEEAVGLGHELLDMGYEVYLNMMGIVCYTQPQLEEAIRLLFDCRVPNVVVSDSFGSLLPSQVRDLVRLFAKGTGKKIGYHAHNNLEMAFANSMAAVEAGASSIDATVYGMGRGAGNLPLEVMLAYLYHTENVPVNLVPLLELIESDFIGLKKELGWGYNLHYMISGLLKCHPNYASALLEEYNMDMTSVWANLMEVSKKNPVKYDRKVLAEIVKEGRFMPPEQRLERTEYSALEPGTVDIRPPSYAGRHRGRDFLVLGNGPSLKEYAGGIKEFARNNNLVVLGANYLQGLIEPDYHAFNHLGRFCKYAKFVSPKSRLLVGSYISDRIVRQYTGREYERLPYMNTQARFGIKDGVIQTNCGTVSLLLIGTAMVMGANRIYVAGLDGYKDVHGEAVNFYLETQEKPTKLETASLQAMCQEYLGQIRDYQLANGMEPFRIITPTSYSEHYAGGVLDGIQDGGKAREPPQ
jgi:4-hydroxy 2-oxovalerate aldolase